MSSSFTAIVMASLPLVIAALRLRVETSEPLTSGRFVGLLVGLAAVAALVGIDLRVAANPL